MNYEEQLAAVETLVKDYKSDTASLDAKIAELQHQRGALAEQVWENAQAQIVDPVARFCLMTQLPVSDKKDYTWIQHYQHEGLDMCGDRTLVWAQRHETIDADRVLDNMLDAYDPTKEGKINDYVDFGNEHIRAWATQLVEARFNSMNWDW